MVKVQSVSHPLNVSPPKQPSSHFSRCSLADVARQAPAPVLPPGGAQGPQSHYHMPQVAQMPSQMPSQMTSQMTLQMGGGGGGLQQNGPTTDPHEEQRSVPGDQDVDGHSHYKQTPEQLITAVSLS